MDIQLHSRNKGTVKTVGFWRRAGSEEGEDDEIGWQGDGHGVLGCTRNHLHWLFVKRANDNWSVLCVVIPTVERRNQEKTSSFKKDPFQSKQCTGAHLCNFDGQNNGIKIRTITTSTGFGAQWRFFISNLKKMAHRTMVHADEEFIVQTDAYFKDLPKSYFLDSLKKLEKRLEKCIELKGDYIEKNLKIYTK